MSPVLTRSALALAILLGLPAAAAAEVEAEEAAGVEIVRPVPRGPGQHGFTIEVPRRPDAYGNFSGIEVMRGSRLPADAAGPVDQSLATVPAPPASADQASAPRRFTAIQVRPVRPVEVAPVAPVAPVGLRGGRTVRVQRGTAPPPPVEAADAEADVLPSALPFALPPGARTIRIR
ncbi:MAG: hypothetical protein JNL66_09605 [Alphaproteobacteria bacterium]|nr:hypothetical protein [Alphaproteobacteria bacterium]